MQIRRVNNIVHIYPIQFTIESVHDHRVHIIMFKYSMCICYGGVKSWPETQLIICGHGDAWKKVSYPSIDIFNEDFKELPIQDTVNEENGRVFFLKNPS